MFKRTYLLWALVLLHGFMVTAQDIQRVRINFHSPENLNRELLLGFTPNNEATDGFDYGYDGAVPDTWPDDLNWLINENRYVIQGVGTFDESKTYPFWLGLSNSGTSTISLITTENFSEEITVYIYDNLYDTYHNISEQPLDLTLSPNEYSGRFFIAFQDPSENNQALSVTDFDDRPKIELSYSAQKNDLIISPSTGTQIQYINVLNAIGQKVMAKSFNSYSEVKLNLPFYQSQVLLIEVITNNGRVIKRILI